MANTVFYGSPFYGHINYSFYSPFYNGHGINNLLQPRKTLFSAVQFTTATDLTVYYGKVYYGHGKHSMVQFTKTKGFTVFNVQFTTTTEIQFTIYFGHGVSIDNFLRPRD